MTGSDPAGVWPPGHVQHIATLARQILILLEGASTIMLIHRDVSYVDVAGGMAAELVRSAGG